MASNSCGRRYLRSQHRQFHHPALTSRNDGGFDGVHIHKARNDKARGDHGENNADNDQKYCQVSMPTTSFKEYKAGPNPAMSGNVKLPKMNL